jgi:hypothetical protein
LVDISSKRFSRIKFFHLLRVDCDTVASQQSLSPTPRSSEMCHQVVSPAQPWDTPITDRFSGRPRLLALQQACVGDSICV